MQGVISGFGIADALGLESISPDRLAYADTGGGLGTLSLFSGATNLGGITLAGDYSDAIFGISDNGGSSTITLLPPAIARTSAILWKSGSSGDFADPTQWTGGVVPSGSADAVIDWGNNPQVVHSTGTHTLHSLDNAAGQFVMAGGTLALNSLENAATIGWSGGALVLSGSADAILHNTGGASLVIAGSGQELGVSGGGTASISNQGTITVDDPSGAAEFDAPLVNTGSMLVRTGTLELDGGGSSAAEQMQAGQTGTLLFGAMAGIANAPTFSVTGGAYAEPNTVVDGSTLDLSGADGAAFGDRLQVSSGVLQLGTAAAVAYGVLTQDGGTISGSGTLSSFGPVSLSGGVQTGGATTRLTAISTLNGTLQLDGGRTLENDGVLAWDTGTLQLGSTGSVSSTATLFNAGVLAFSHPGQIIGLGDGGTVANAGVLIVGSGTGAAQIDSTFDSTGVVEVRSGTLDLNGGGSGFSMAVSAGAMLQFGAAANGAAGDTFTEYSGIKNDGTVTATAGRLTLQRGSSGSGEFVLDGTATMDFVNGIGAGATLSFLHPGGTLVVESPGNFNAVVDGYTNGDVIDVTPVSFTAAVATFGSGTLNVSDGRHSAAFQLTGSFATNGFHVVNDGHGGAAISYG